MILIQKALFAPGQMVVHQPTGYLGLIVDVDAVFVPDGMAVTYPHQADRPWYYLLVGDGEEICYVSETDLYPVESADGFSHSLLPAWFENHPAGAMRSPHSLH